MTRLGVFGGTFDPPHLGHIAAASTVRRKLELDAVLFVVANDPWQKSPSRRITPAGLRLGMVQAALLGIEGLHPCALEIARGGQSFMADTLAELRDGWPGAELFLIVGSDAAAGLSTWKRPREVEREATAAVVVRGGCEDGRPPPGWPCIVVDGPVIDISSAGVRARRAAGRSVRSLVPAAVAEVIGAWNLYESTTPADASGAPAFGFDTAPASHDSCRCVRGDRLIGVCRHRRHSLC